MAKTILTPIEENVNCVSISFLVPIEWRFLFDNIAAQKGVKRTSLIRQLIKDTVINNNLAYIENDKYVTDVELPEEINYIINKNNIILESVK